MLLTSCHWRLFPCFLPSPHPYCGDGDAFCVSADREAADQGTWPGSAIYQCDDLHMHTAHPLVRGRLQVQTEITTESNWLNNLQFFNECDQPYNPLFCLDLNLNEIGVYYTRDQDYQTLCAVVHPDPLVNG